MLTSTILLKLVLAHIISDFFLQTQNMVKGKLSGGKTRWSWLSLHSFIHSIVAYLLVAQWNLWYVPIVLFLSHFIIDMLKTSSHQDNITIFIADQFAHLIIIIGLWLCLIPETFSNTVDYVMRILPDRIWLYIIAYTLILKPTSVLMAILLKRWTISNSTSSLPDAGKWIGYLERIMILTFIIGGKMEGVGFLLAAKSVFRFGDLNKAKDIKTTEYVMIGTMSSFALTIIIGLLIA